jgi:serine/threonine-protein kinase
MVMEYIEGVSLEKYLTEHGPLSSQGALTVVTQVADALSYSHSKEIFHRDIKSSNIILINSESGLSVRIIDFGIAMLTQAQQEPTIVQGRTVVGTPAYMSPDQALGQNYDERSEVYSVGCIFFEALAGETPFSGGTALEIINKHAKEAVPHIIDKNPDTDCTPEIEAIIFTCLAKQKEDRYQSMAELRNACEAYGKTTVVSDENLFEEELERNTSHERFERKSSIDAKWMILAGALVAIIGVATVGIFVKHATTVEPAPMLTKHKISQNAGGIL